MVFPTGQAAVARAAQLQTKRQVEKTLTTDQLRMASLAESLVVPSVDDMLREENNTITWPEGVEDNFAQLYSLHSKLSGETSESYQKKFEDSFEKAKVKLSGMGTCLIEAVKKQATIIMTPMFFKFLAILQDRAHKPSETPSFDPLLVAAEIQAALKDSTSIVTDPDKCGLKKITANKDLALETLSELSRDLKLFQAGASKLAFPLMHGSLKFSDSDARHIHHMLALKTDIMDEKSKQVIPIEFHSLSTAQYESG